VRGIPAIVVVQLDGTKIDPNVRAAVQTNNPGSFVGWATAWKETYTSVRVAGLKGAPQHNGAEASLLSFDGAKGRYTLRLSATGQHLSMRPSNVELFSLVRGTRVGIHGVVRAAEHNGKRDTVRGGVGPKTRRYAVALEGGEQTLGLKLECLLLVEQADLMLPEEVD
jgi:hypothetical protein